MSETTTLLLANMTTENVMWEVTPEGAAPIRITQAPHQYGAISVPFRPKYAVCVLEGPDRQCTEVTEPNALVVWDGGGLHGLSSASPASAV